MTLTDTVQSVTPDTPGWPLPLGHRYGPQGLDLRNHDGRSNLVEHRGLQAWQEAYRHRIKRTDFRMGYYDSVTQMAAADLQKAAGLPVTGMIDLDTWNAVWQYVKPPQLPPEKPQPTKSQLRLRAKRQKDYWRRVSQHTDHITDGSQPPWWPGRPFGPGESGWHVERLQELLQARKTGTFNRETASRVRAARRKAGLPVSDLVDLTLAVVLDPGPWVVTPE